MAEAPLCLAMPVPAPKHKRLTVITSHSLPACPRIAQDLLANLAPPVVLDALVAPDGSLRACLDAASAFDRDFAKRSVLVSQRIWEWLAELEDWAWPTNPGFAVFESPNGCRADGDHGFVGSLSAADVARYGKRIDEIHEHINELAVEDIKRHVLGNLIAPLSRPKTPVAGSTCHASTSVSSYNRMDDVAAVTTAIVLHALSNLARLSRLLRTWTIRLRAFQRMPSLLYVMRDADAALKSAWAATALHPSGEESRTDADVASRPPFLKRQDLEVMQRALVAKVAEPGRILDSMLGCVEDMAVVVPDHYLDRVEALQRDCSEWIAYCERKVHESKWTTLSRTQSIPRSAFSSPDQHSQSRSRPRSPGLLDEPISLQASPKANKDQGVDEHVDEIATEWETLVPCSRSAADKSPTTSDACGLTSSGAPALCAPSDRCSADTVGNDRQRATSSHSEAPSLITDDGEASTVRGTQSSPGLGSINSSPAFDRSRTPVEEPEEPELPRLRESASRTSLVSQESTLMFGDSSHFGPLSSDPPQMSASPPGLSNRILPIRRWDDSPTGTPARLSKSGSGELTTGLLDSLIASPPDGEMSMFFRSPADQSFVDAFDDSASMTGSLIQGESRRDRQLEQQLSEIIESIPAKIKLFSEPAPVNLNPPELHLPRIGKKPSREQFRRSASTLSFVSSRAATPSFTLSPVKQPWPRHRRTQQEIKVYHLARSTGEPPIKLFIRCVGEHGERVMVRVGGGWADLSEYLKEYVSHHGRRPAGTDKAKIEVRDVPRASAGFAPDVGSSPPRPGSAAAGSPATPLYMHKAHRTIGAPKNEALRASPRPSTPASAGGWAVDKPPPPSGDSARSRSSSRLSWYDDDGSFLGLAGPTGKKVEMSEENRDWVKSVKEKVRLASGEHRGPLPGEKSQFGDLGTVGGTKRLFRQADDRGRR